MGALCLARDHNCECHHDVPTHHFDRGILVLKDLVKTTDQQPSGLVGTTASVATLTFVMYVVPSSMFAHVRPYL